MAAAPQVTGATIGEDGLTITITTDVATRGTDRFYLTSRHNQRGQIVSLQGAGTTTRTGSIPAVVYSDESPTLAYDYGGIAPDTVITRNDDGTTRLFPFGPRPVTNNSTVFYPGDPVPFRHNLSSVVGRWDAITPSDTEDVPGGSCLVYVGVAGDLRVAGTDGVPATFQNYGPGWFPGVVTRVYDAETTADGLIAGW